MWGRRNVQGALSNVLRGAGGALVLVMYDELKVSRKACMSAVSSYVRPASGPWLGGIMWLSISFPQAATSSSTDQYAFTLQTIIDANLG
jgi:hypothetical protein